MKNRCFVDANGHVFTLDANGVSNYPGDIEINERVVRVLGAYDETGQGRLVEAEYRLWPSLTELLAATLELELNQTISDFEAYGFVQTHYPGQDGVFLVKKFNGSAIGERWVDLFGAVEFAEIKEDDDEISIDIIPGNGMVQLYILDKDLLLGPYDKGSPHAGELLALAFSVA